MNANPLLGLLFHWVGGFSAASCYLPFRPIRQWSWEIYWFVQGCFSWIIAPAIFALILVPGVGNVLHSASLGTIGYTFFWGAMWGVGGLLFGLGVRYLGVALGYTIALGFSTTFGTLVPPLFAGQLTGIAAERSGKVTLGGIALCVAAIAVSGMAGRMKERELTGQTVEEAASPGGHGEFRFGLGAWVAMFAGIFSACFAYGLAAAKPINEAARYSLLTHGRSDLWQTLPALIVVLWGGWTTNALWCAGLLLKNKSGRQFLSIPRMGNGQLAANYGLAASAGLLWYGQFFFYSMGQTRMGPYDFSSWTLHMAGTIFFATLWGAVLKEWRGTSGRTKLIGASGLIMLLLSTIVVGYGNYLKAHEAPLVRAVLSSPCVQSTHKNRVAATNIMAAMMRTGRL